MQLCKICKNNLLGVTTPTDDHNFYYTQIDLFISKQTQHKQPRQPCRHALRNLNTLIQCDAWGENEINYQTSKTSVRKSHHRRVYSITWCIWKHFVAVSLDNVFHIFHHRHHIIYLLSFVRVCLFVWINIIHPKGGVHQFIWHRNPFILIANDFLRSWKRKRERNSYVLNTTNTIVPAPENIVHTITQ